MTITLIDVQAGGSARPRAYGDSRPTGVLGAVAVSGAMHALTDLTAAAACGLGGEYRVPAVRCTSVDGAFPTITDDNFITRSGPPPGRPPA